MKIIRSIFIAFAMYSRIPVPRTEWNEENMKYSIAFFPLVGIVITALLFLWHFLCSKFDRQISDMAEALIAVSIPIWISGGIHADGFIDTSDALSSHRDREKKLEILKDAHIGAFAVISYMSYYAVFVALYLIVLKSRTEFGILALGFILSRILSAMGVVFFKCAKNDGLLYTFADKTDLTVSRTIIAAEFILCEAAMIHVNPMGAFIALFLNLTFLLYYYRMTSREFGGITGDTCGWFSTGSELVTALSAAVGVIASTIFW